MKKKRDEKIENILAAIIGISVGMTFAFLAYVLILAAL